MPRLAHCLAPIVLAAVVVSTGACGGGDSGSPDSTDPSPADVDAPADAVAATVAATVVAGADLFDTDFAQVCRGTGQPAATGYEQVAGVHPFVALTSDDGTEFTGSYTVTVPDGWSVLYPDLASAELVMCQSLVSTTPTELCTGYTDDENPDAGESSVQMYDATYEVSVRVATTAEVLHTETVEASDDTCPMLVFFDEADPDPKPWNSTIDAGEFELLVKPFVTPS